MSAITFQLHTKQPILATSFQGDPNSDVSYDYLPGSMIRGALISRYLKSHPSLCEDILVDENVQRLFFNGQTQYLNAYLLSQETKQSRSLPVPLSWFKDKGAELPMPIYDLSQMELFMLPSEVSPKRVENSFCTVNFNEVKLYTEKRRINIHNKRDRRRGRSTEATGEVFRYEALDTGQTFQAVVLCQPTDREVIESLLRQNENVWLGGSQTAGYGHTQISHIEFHENWNEVGDSLETRINRQTLQITLLSNLILQNEWGQYVV